MRIPRIFTGQVLQAGSRYDLEPGPSQHLARALRMQVGDLLTLFDGRGGEYRATIDAISKKQVTVLTSAHEARDVESPLSIHLGIAVSRGDRMDWVVQKATELGVGAITPLLTERTEVRLSGERLARKVAHWQQVVVSACEQSGRNTVPRVATLTASGDWLGSVDAEQKLVLHHRASSVDAPAGRPATLALLIGPEGGLSDDEITAAEQAGFRSVSLGRRVLRTETAPIAALAILQSRWGDMGL
ncbi:16S rRNA (uracil(1498)-N(3))-methyltransferase [Pseudohalioglobus sediminis]|uniref:Ribosomal RNA small subunit methyltransferase E n=1 Tax=Pseudohalioglobus sediminis TaxID=2606449 RepID=A0A5B0WX03_9GAMM|nr:16S rRNA (uracil(1498)-N(3))-methyltransferase [Pseudohalioglobus sediminis]KAA1190419.1 16S rRNA (uracil(1498)-N(3))-methyltransferase [Pseudohalioglobus sediminis]